MRWLRFAGYRVLSMDDMLQLRAHHELAPERAVVLTFDDGYADNCRLAYPILRHYNFPVTIFLVSAAVGTANCWDRDGPLANRPLMSWPDIGAIQSGRVSFGAHTRAHTRLTTLSPADAESEISGSRAELERALRQPISVFAYPYGKMNRTIQGLVQRAGFAAACSIQPGRNSPATSSLALRRIEISGTMSLLWFILVLVLGDPLQRTRARRLP
jgi:peptidoglycan/xylan/chitin deacetylase (PgdA/CDA1 family)